jgi:hypothetical protein
MSVLSELRATVDAQRRALGGIEPGCLSGEDALALLRDECRRVKTAGRDERAIYEAIKRERSMRLHRR